MVQQFRAARRDCPSQAAPIRFVPAQQAIAAPNPRLMRPGETAVRPFQHPGSGTHIGQQIPAASAPIGNYCARSTSTTTRVPLRTTRFLITAPDSSSVTRVFTIFSPKPLPDAGSKFGGSPGAVVDHLDCQSSPMSFQVQRDFALLRRSSKPMLNGIRQQLSDHHGQRCHNLRWQQSCCSLPLNSCVNSQFASEHHDPIGDFVEISVSPSCCESVSWTTAIAPTRRTASARAACPAGSSMRLACSRRRAATVCGLFFTRWWISRIVESFVSSASPVAVRHVTDSTSAPR